MALYQSCAAGVEAEQILEKSSADPKASVLVGYFNQMSFYRELNVSHNVLNSPLVRALLDATKQRFSAFKMLNVSPNHFNYTKDLPANCVLLVLQHNKAKTELISAVLEAPKLGSTSTGGKASRLQTQTSTSAYPKPKTTVVKAPTDSFQLYHLQQLWKEWKSELQAFNLKIEFQQDNELIKKNSGSSLMSPLIGLSDLMKLYLNPNNPVRLKLIISLSL